MCGIAGIVDREGRPIEPELLKRITSALNHRGPDAEGFYLNPAAQAGRPNGGISCGLGHRRLKVIDLASGAQPMADETGALQIVFNGEIYNYRELRGSLAAKGCKFRTQSDTEVILQAYAAEGPECVRNLRGMFAFALWDETRQRLMLARDRLGKKPLVYAFRSGQMVFSSQLESLLQHPAIERRLDREAIHHYLSFMCVPSPGTAFEGVQKLPPAHYLLYDGKELQLTRYWELDFHRKIKISAEEAVEEINRLLEESVRLRLRSDVPLGVLLSGGVDSSAVVSVASRLMSGQRLKTFSIGFEEASFNELPYARAVAKKFNTDHHDQIVRPNASAIIPKLIRQFGEPFADSSALPTYYLAQIASREVTVVLNGDGGDEAFGGYYRHLAMRLADSYNDLPVWLRRGLIEPVMGAWPDRLALLNGRMSPKRFFRAAGIPRGMRWLHWTGLFSDEEKRALYTPQMAAQTKHSKSAALLNRLFDGLEDLDGVDAALAVDTSFYLPNDLLVKMDICTMAHGLEARAPLLDHQLMEFLASLPGQMKVKGRSLKHLLKETQKGIFTQQHLQRPKQGFSIPVGRWFRGPLKEWMSGILLSSQAQIHQLILPERLKNLVSRHISGEKDYGHHLWTLLMLELWLQHYMHQEKPLAKETTAVHENV